MLLTQSCPTLCDPVDCSPPGSSVHGILLARILGCSALLQAVFQTQGSHPVLLHWGQTPYCQPPGSPTLVHIKVQMDQEEDQFIWQRFVERVLYIRRGTELWGFENSLLSQMVMQEPWVWSLGQEDPLEEGMATHSVFLPGESHGQRSLAGCSPRGHQETELKRPSTHAQLLHRHMLTGAPLGRWTGRCQPSPRPPTFPSPRALGAQSEAVPSPRPQAT